MNERKRKGKDKKKKKKKSSLQWKIEFIRAAPQIRDKPRLTYVLGNTIQTELLTKQRQIHGLKIKEKERESIVKLVCRHKHTQTSDTTSDTVISFPTS